MAAPEINSTRPTSPWLHAFLVAGIGFVLIIGCFRAGFLTYDDPVHVPIHSDNSLSSDVFAPIPNSTYFPVTLLSYRLDQMLFQRWMPAALGSWAPGVRFMNCVYHAAAALILWRLLLLLRFSPMQSLFVSLAFAAHPLACETVCWAAERKNALAAMFGFAAIWVWLKIGNEPIAKTIVLRVIATSAFYSLALLSKPSALGIFPVLLILDLFNAPRGLEGGTATSWRPSSNWVQIALTLLPLAIISILVVRVNIAGHSQTLLPPPGGSVFTAALTDLEILMRYIGNLLMPFALSAAYFVQPVSSIADWRVAIFGLSLVIIVGGTVRIAARPRVALLGWLWFLGALGPSLNFIAITFLMQDRYIYLSTPGFFIVIAEVAAGLAQRKTLVPVIRLGAPAYIALFAALGISRGGIWANTFDLFQDAVEKQPQSSFARHGLGLSYAQAWHMLTKNGAVDSNHQAPEFHRQWIENWRLSLHCPDAGRNLYYCLTANRVGEEYFKEGKNAEAEEYWGLGANPPANRPDEPDARSKCLAQLSKLRLAEQKIDESFFLANKAIQARPGDMALMARANAAISLAKARQSSGDNEYAKRLVDEAKRDLQAIPSASKLYAVAQKTLTDPLFALNAPRN